MFTDARNQTFLNEVFSLQIISIFHFFVNIFMAKWETIENDSNTFLPLTLTKTRTQNNFCYRPSTAPVHSNNSCAAKDGFD